MPLFRLSLLLLALCSFAAPTLAGKVNITELNWLDKKHLKSQVDIIDDLVRTNIGAQIHGNKADLEILQRIIYRGLVDKTDRKTLQALGVVLGNVLSSELGLAWVNYEDGRGKSRAICAVEVQECVFPITILSRRMEVGLLPNVEELYNDSIEVMQPHLPKSPFDAYMDRK